MTIHRECRFAEKDVCIEKVESLDRMKTLTLKYFIIMKKYQKAQIVAKNLPSGSYAAGCPAEGSLSDRCMFSKGSLNKYCKKCERSE